LKVAANWHKLMVPLHNMQSSVLVSHIHANRHTFQLLSTSSTRLYSVAHMAGGTDKLLLLLLLLSPFVQKVQTLKNN